MNDTPRRTNIPLDVMGSTRWTCLAVPLLLSACGAWSDPTPAPDQAAVTQGEPEDPPLRGPDGPPDDAPPSQEAPAGPDTRLSTAPCEGRAEGEPCFVEIPAGQVLLGAQRADPDAPGFDALATDDDGPVRTEAVERFWIQATEATLGELVACGHAGPCADFAPDTTTIDTHLLPAQSLSWSQAATLCRHLGGRLPTEAEWVRAARGDSAHRWPWGDGPRCPYNLPAYLEATDRILAETVAACPAVQAAAARHGSPELIDLVDQTLLMLRPDEFAAICAAHGDAPTPTHAQALEALARERLATGRHSEVLPPACRPESPRVVHDSRGRTPFDLRGLTGNVAEWVEDTWAEGDPRRTLKGGSFLSESPAAWRVAGRQPLPPEASLPDVGVRCARNSPP